MMRRCFILALLMPFLLANKNCDHRAATWGKKDALVAPWAADHVDFDKDTQCADCHDNPMTKKTRPKSHDLSWNREHGKYGNLKYGYRDQNVCYLCHTEASCTRCHQDEAPQDHTEYWRLRGHAAAVGLDRSRCEACHRSDSCERCHQSVKPSTHTAAWGRTAEQHCLNCHYPIQSVGAQACASCHRSTPSHNSTPARPNNGLHVDSANCRSCHAATLRHPDNGMTCTTCHQ